MEELAKKIQQKYVDDITSKYPLYRFLCLYIYLLSFYVFYVEKEQRLIASFFEMKVDFLFDFDGGLLAQVSVFYLIAAIVVTFVMAKVSNKIKSKSFQLISTISSFDEYLGKIKARLSEARSDNSAIAYSMTSDVTKQLDIKRAILKGKQAISEIVLALMVCVLIGVVNMIFVDWVVVFSCAVMILFLQWESFKLYLSEFLPYFVAEQILLGKDVSFSSGDNEPHE